MRLTILLLALAVCVSSAHVRSPSQSLDPALVELEADPSTAGKVSSPVLTDLNVKNFGEQGNDVSTQQATREELGKLLAHYADVVRDHKQRIASLKANLTSALEERQKLKDTADTANAVATKSLERFLRLQTRIEGLMLRLQGWAITNLRHQARVLLNVDPSKFNATASDEFRRMRRALSRASFELRESYNYLIKVVKAVDERRDMHVFGKVPNEKEVDAAIVEMARVDLEMSAMEQIRNRTLSTARGLRDRLRKHRKYLSMYNNWSFRTKSVVEQVSKLLARGLLEARLHPDFPPVDDCPEYLNGSVCVPKPADVNVRVKVHVNISKDGNSTVTLISSNEPECTDLNSPKCQKALMAVNGAKPDAPAWVRNASFPASLPPPAIPNPPTQVIPGATYDLAAAAAAGIRRYTLDGYCVFPNDPACTLNDLNVAVGIHIDRDGTPRLVVGARANSTSSAKVRGIVPSVALPYTAPPPPLPPPRAGLAVKANDNSSIPATAYLPILQGNAAAVAGPTSSLPAGLSIPNGVLGLPPNPQPVPVYQFVNGQKLPIPGPAASTVASTQVAASGSGALVTGTVSPAQQAAAAGALAATQANVTAQQTAQQAAQQAASSGVAAASTAAAAAGTTSSGFLDKLIKRQTSSLVIRTEVNAVNGTDGKLYVRVQRINNATGQVLLDQTLPLNISASVAFNVVQSMLKSGAIPGLNPKQYFVLPGSNSTNATASNTTISSNATESASNSSLPTTSVPAYAFGGAGSIVLPATGNITTTNSSTIVVDRAPTPGLGPAAAVRGRKLITTQRVVTIQRPKKDGPGFDVQTRVFTDVKDVTPPPPPTVNHPQYPQGSGSWDNGGNVVNTAIGDMVVNRPNLTFKDRQAISRRLAKIQQAINNGVGIVGQAPSGVTPQQVPAGTTSTAAAALPYNTNTAPRFRASAPTSSDSEEQHFFESGVNSQSKPSQATDASTVAPRISSQQTSSGMAGLDVASSSAPAPAPSAAGSAGPVLKDGVFYGDDEEENFQDDINGDAFLELFDGPSAPADQAAKQSSVPVPNGPALNSGKAPQSADPQPAPQAQQASGQQKMFSDVEEEMQALHAQWSHAASAKEAPKAAPHKEESSENSEETAEGSDEQQVSQMLDEATRKLPRSIARHMAAVQEAYGDNLEKDGYVPKGRFLSSKLGGNARKTKVISPRRSSPVKKESEAERAMDTAVSSRLNGKQKKAMQKKELASIPWAEDSGDLDDGEDENAAKARVNHAAEREGTEESAEAAEASEEGLDDAELEKAVREIESEQNEGKPSKPKPKKPTAAPAPAHKGPFEKMEKNSHGAVVRGKPLAIDKKLAKLEPVLSKMQPTVGHDYSLHSHGHFPRVRPSKAVLKKAMKALKKHDGKARLAAARTTSNKLMNSQFEKITRPEITAKMLQDLAKSANATSAVSNSTVAPAVPAANVTDVVPPAPVLPGTVVNNPNNRVSRLVKRLQGLPVPPRRRHHRRNVTGDTQWNAYPRVRSRVQQNNTDPAYVIQFNATKVTFPHKTTWADEKRVVTIDGPWAGAFKPVGPGGVTTTPTPSPTPAGLPSRPLEPTVGAAPTPSTPTSTPGAASPAAPVPTPAAPVPTPAGSISTPLTPSTNGTRRHPHTHNHTQILDGINKQYGGIKQPPPADVRPRQVPKARHPRVKLPAPQPGLMPPNLRPDKKAPTPAPQPVATPAPKPAVPVPAPAPKPVAAPTPAPVAQLPRGTPNGFAPKPTQPVVYSAPVAPTVYTPAEDGTFVSSEGKKLKPATVDGKKWGKSNVISSFDRDGLVSNLQNHAKITGASVDANSKYPSNQKLFIRENVPSTIGTTVLYSDGSAVPTHANNKPCNGCSSPRFSQTQSDRIVEPAQLGDSEIEAEVAQPHHAPSNLLGRLFERLHH